jgi:DNA-directed RNA polymerase subunit RPC12/RpoP
MKSTFRAGGPANILVEPSNYDTGYARQPYIGGRVALPAINAKCPNCGREFRAVPKRSFLSFQKMRCPSCTKDVVYPLTKGYRIIYWAILALMLVAVVVNYTNGQPTYPGLLGFAALIALVEDARIRKAASVRSVS